MYNVKNRVVTAKMTHELKHRDDAGGIQVSGQGKSTPGKRPSVCKGPGAGLGLVCWRDSNEARVAGAEGRREEVRAEKGWGGSCRGLWALGRTSASSLREVGALQGSGQRKDKTNSDAHRCCLAAAGRAGSRETRPRATWTVHLRHTQCSVMSKTT